MTIYKTKIQDYKCFTTQYGNTEFTTLKIGEFVYMIDNQTGLCYHVNVNDFVNHIPHMLIKQRNWEVEFLDNGRI